MMDETESVERHALRELVRHVAYAQHWLRQTEAFEYACKALDLKFCHRDGILMEVKTTRIPDPYEDSLTGRQR